jgi:uncharacterized protein (TIGR04255 family)
MNESNLNLPDYEIKDYKRNLIKTAVCELKFPVILELEHKPPATFHSSIRKKYPHFERRTSINLQLGSDIKETVYVFLSRNQDWTLSVRPSSISLETTNYTSFTNFTKRLKIVISSANKFIDSDFFTRVGLRYIDNIPINKDSFEDWINPDIVKPLTIGIYGQPDLYWQNIRSNCQNGKFSFQHGIQNSNVNQYILDFDFYKENVEANEVNDLLINLHKESLKLFFWSINNKSYEYMNSSGV